MCRIPAVGKARRMQVREPMLQHEVMIEAVENHNPEVIVIDEIGRELEAAAARTIAERGVQLIGTAHGQTLDNLLLNPTLSDLVGGIEAVTLSDEEARRRGTQKTVLERRAPPTFDVLVEIQNRDRFAVHADIMNSVDALLRGFPLPPEIRTRDTEGKIQIEKAAPPSRHRRLDAKETKTPTARTPAGGTPPKRPAATPSAPAALRAAARRAAGHQDLSVRRGAQPPDAGGQAPGRAGHHREGAGRGQRAGDPEDLLPRPPADHRGCRAPRPADLCAALQHGRADGAVPGRTVQCEGRTDRLSSEIDGVKEQTQQAIAAVLNGERWVDLPPGPSLVRRLEHEMARQAELVSHSYGKEPRRHVRIFRE